MAGCSTRFSHAPSVAEVVRRQVVRITERASDQTAMIEDVHFEDCEILGPALLVPLDHVSFDETSFDGHPDAFLWEVSEDRIMIGVIGLRNVRFYRCRMKHIGLVGTPEVIKKFRSSLAQP
jgi:hypothetical protein